MSDYKEVLGSFIKNDSLYNGGAIMSLAYCSAFPGNAVLKPPYFEYPFEKADGKIFRKDKIWHKWQKVLTDYEPLMENYKKKNSVIENIVIEFGRDDKNPFSRGNQDFSTLLYNNRIPHEYRYYKGNHGALNERLRQSMFHYLSQHLSFDRKFIIINGRDNTVKLWDQVTKEKVSSSKGHAGSAGSLCFTKDDRYRVSGRGRNVSYWKPMKYYNLMPWDVVRGELISLLPEHEDGVKDGEYLTASSRD